MKISAGGYCALESILQMYATTHQVLMIPEYGGSCSISVNSFLSFSHSLQLIIVKFWGVFLRVLLQCLKIPYPNKDRG